MRRDPIRAARLDGLASRKKPLATPAVPAADKPPADKSTDKSTTPKKKELCRGFKRTGECRFGDSCKFEHAASADATAATANPPAAIAMQDPEEDQMGVDLEEFTCGADLGPGCTKIYKTCPSFWVELGKKHNKVFVTPTSCKYCRKIKRENRNNHRAPTMKVDSDGKPVEVVADLTMAAIEPVEDSFFSDIDADDDDAMADYASRFSSDLMMTVDHEEIISEDDIPISFMRRSPLPAKRHRRKACDTCDMSAEMATAIVECTQQAAARKLKSSLEAGELALETQTDAGPLVPESVQIAAETCLHPDVFCPNGYSLVDYVANMYCPACGIKVDVDISTCWESCPKCDKPTESSDDNFADGLDPVEHAAGVQTGAISYTPRMDYIRSTLQKVLDFHIQNLIRSWLMYATLDNLIRHSETQLHANTTLESASTKPWRQLNLTSSWLKPAKQNTASIFDTPRAMLQVDDSADDDPCLTCNEQEHLIIWCRGCNFGECKLCVETRGYLRCLCSAD